MNEPEKDDRDAHRQVMVVTGGSRGIGAAVCREAAKAGYAVAFSYLENRSAAEALLQSMEQSGTECLAVQSDVSDEQDVIGLFDTATESFGPVTALVNNAGILETQMSLADMSAQRMDRVIATNLRGSMLCAREAVRRMALSRGGRGGGIVNVSSRAAALGAPGEYVDYAATKGAIDTLTIGLAKEVAGEGIRVNAVRPGVIETEIHASGGEPGRVDRVSASIPMGRGGTAREVAETIMWLLSDQSAYCTGSLLDVSGGR